MLKFVAGMVAMGLMALMWLIQEMVKAELVGHGYWVNIAVLAAMAVSFFLGKIKLED